MSSELITALQQLEQAAAAVGRLLIALRGYHLPINPVRRSCRS